MGGDRDSGLVREHLGLVLTLVTGTVVFARLLLVSGFNYETAVTLLTLQGTATTTVGSLLAVANLVPFAALLIVVYAAASDMASTGSISHSYKIAYIVLSLITVLTAPLVLGVIVAIALVANAFVSWRRGRADQPGDAEGSAGARLRSGESVRRRMAIQSGHRIVILWAVIVGGQALAYAPPWMPAEQITTTDDDRTTNVVGYVLKADDHELVVLLDSPREVKRLTSASGFERAFCEIPINLVAGGRALVVHLLANKPNYSRCPPEFR